MKEFNDRRTVKNGCKWRRISKCEEIATRTVTVGKRNADACCFFTSGDFSSSSGGEPEGVAWPGPAVGGVGGALLWKCFRVRGGVGERRAGGLAEGEQRRQRTHRHHRCCLRRRRDDAVHRSSGQFGLTCCCFSLTTGYTVDAHRWRQIYNQDRWINAAKEKKFNT